MTDPLAYLRQREEDRSQGIAWAQRCLEGVAENKTIPHEGGRAAEDFLRGCGWEKIGTQFRGRRYSGFGKRGYEGNSTCYTYRSSDGRFLAFFAYSRFSTPTCWCGFEVVND